MRTFERYLNRRRITNPIGYFAAKGISTNADLAAWCAASHVEEPITPLFNEAVIKETAPSLEKKTTAADHKETWHTPAAERPLRKPVKKAKAKSKASAPKRKANNK